MHLQIGTNIKKLRLEKGITQEEVASHLGISPQSVSKWERDEGYPDITMLPAIANYFAISIDFLLGMHKNEVVYNQINAQWEQNRVNGLHTENINLMKDALKTFPNDALLLVQLAASLERVGGRNNMEESAKVQEQILKYGEDSEIRSATLYNICFTYDQLGNRQKAIECAKKLSNLYKARENAFVYFLEGEEKQQNSRQALIPIISTLKLHLHALGKDDLANEIADRLNY